VASPPFPFIPKAPKVAIASPATNSKSSHISIASPVTNFEEYPYFHYIASHKLASNGHHHGSSMQEENNTKRKGLQGITYKLLAD
jgi:hypothetical protein